MTDINTQHQKKRIPNQRCWLLFFYSLPSKPVGNRMKVWRMLTKAGAVPFKGSGYLLPFSDDHYEIFQWLVSSIAAMQGDAAFVKVETIETMKDSEVIALFNECRAKDYLDLEKKMDQLERKLSGLRRGANTMNGKKIQEELNKFVKEFQQIGKIDFFSSDERKTLEERLDILAKEFEGLTGADGTIQPVEIEARQVADYQRKLWVTRKKPFIDRMASAWLIKRFIDNHAEFGFIDENDLEVQIKGSIGFDTMGGEFTHVGGMSTFEVLIAAFRLKDKALASIAEIIHQLDLHDEKFNNPAAEGLREILEGVRKTAKDDHEALQKGMSVIDMLYASKVSD